MSGLFYAARSPAEVNHIPRAEPPAVRASPHSYTDSAPQESYLGSAACSRCHAEIYGHFVRTSMGRSITQVTPESLRGIPGSGQVYDEKLDRHYEVSSHDGNLYQSEYQVDSQGKEVFRNTHRIDWIIGAKANGAGALIKRGDYIFEAPLSFYAQTGKWDLSPGYQRGDYGFNRAIAPGCIFCHTGRAQPVPHTIGKYESTPFPELAIGCENCHGPGAAHVRAMGLGDSYPHGKDPTIVNPAKLTPALADSICMSCHQTGDTRVFQPGKSYQDFRPGMALDRVMAILMVPPTRDNPPSEDHVQHYYAMTMSKCYQASASNPTAKQMRCITCHDPHIEPTSAEAPAFFNGKCLTCHTAQSCKAPAEVRSSRAPGNIANDNCIGCHMPKRDNASISHSSLTNHRIVARADEPYPSVAFEETTPALPDLIHLNRIQGDHSALPAVTLLQAYDQLKEQRPEYLASYLKTLSELQKDEPGNAIVQAAAGHRDLVNGKLEEAAQHLQNSLRLDPAQPMVYADLSAIADQRGEAPEALTLAQKAVILDPYSTALRKALVLRLIHAKQYDEAETSMARYLEDFPEDEFMRKMLAIARQP